MLFFELFFKVIKKKIKSPIVLIASKQLISKQVKILKQAKEDFKDMVFLNFEQTKDKKIAKFLGIDYWTTIVVYKDNKEISRTIGQTSKDEIYSQIKP